MRAKLHSPSTTINSGTTITPLVRREGNNPYHSLTPPAHTQRSAATRAQQPSTTLRRMVTTTNAETREHTDAETRDQTNAETREPTDEETRDHLEHSSFLTGYRAQWFPDPV